MPGVADIELARRAVAPFVADGGARAAIVAGSVAEGVADEHSDLDLILFYDELPAEPVVEAARVSLGAAELFPLGGSREVGVFLEQFRIGTVACQFVHQTIGAWEAQTRTVLDELDVDSPAQKALSGLHAAVVLHGDELVAELRERARYTDGLQRAMVERHLEFFPLWRLQDSLARRDALLWQRAELVKALQNVLAVLAGVNRVFFSTFQLKRVRALAATFERAPDRLAERIDAALVAPAGAAAYALEELVGETVAIVEHALPDIDTANVRRALTRS